MTDIDQILSKLDDQHRERSSEIADLRSDIQALTVQVKETNGRVSSLERWREYLQGVSDTLQGVRDGGAWKLPAATASAAAIVAAVLSVVLAAVIH